MRIKINYQINEKNIMKEIEMCYLQDLKYINNKIEELTQALETIILKN